MTAYTELTDELVEGEYLEAIVFGPYGWDGYSEPEPAPVPAHIMGKPLSPDMAKPYMMGWSFFGGYGAPHCYAIYAWSTGSKRRLFWITQYDGSTTISSGPRDPLAVIPEMPGGSRYDL